MLEIVCIPWSFHSAPPCPARSRGQIRETTSYHSLCHPDTVIRLIYVHVMLPQVPFRFHSLSFIISYSSILLNFRSSFLLYLFLPFVYSGPWRDTEVRRAFTCARQLLYVLRSVTRGPAYVYNIQTWSHKRTCATHRSLKPKRSFPSFAFIPTDI